MFDQKKKHNSFRRWHFLNIFPAWQWLSHITQIKLIGTRNGRATIMPVDNNCYNNDSTTIPKITGICSRLGMAWLVIGAFIGVSDALRVLIFDGCQCLAFLQLHTEAFNAFWWFRLSELFVSLMNCNIETIIMAVTEFKPQHKIQSQWYKAMHTFGSVHTYPVRNSVKKDTDRESLFTLYFLFLWFDLKTMAIVVKFAIGNGIVKLEPFALHPNQCADWIVSIQLIFKCGKRNSLCITTHRTRKHSNSMQIGCTRLLQSVVGCILFWSWCTLCDFPLDMVCRETHDGEYAWSNNKRCVINAIGI